MWQQISQRTQGVTGHLYPSSSDRRFRPHGWHSQMPSAESHLQMWRCIASEFSVVSGGRLGLASRPSGARPQALHKRRCRLRRTTGVGGLMAQFWTGLFLAKLSKQCRGWFPALVAQSTRLTRHTTRPQRRQSETKSRAHCPALTQCWCLLSIP